MTKHRSSLVAATLLLVFGWHAWPAAAHTVELNYEFALRSPHVWRGITLREFPVLSASATARYSNGFATQLWIGIDLSDNNGREGEIQEIDLDLSYTWETDRSSFTFGFIELIFPGGIDSTGEIYAIGRSKGLLTPRLEIYYNVDLLHDIFALFSLNHRWRLIRGWTPSATTTLAYAGAEYAKFFGGSKGGLHHWSLNLDFDFRPRRSGVKLRLGYSESLNGNVLPDQPVSFWGGLYLSILQP